MKDSSLSWYIIATTQAVLKHATVAPHNAKKEYLTKIMLIVFVAILSDLPMYLVLFGARLPSTPFIIPMDAKLENPHNA